MSELPAGTIASYPTDAPIPAGWHDYERENPAEGYRWIEREGVPLAP